VAQQAGRADARLLVQLAFGGAQQVLAVVNAALRKLPVVRRQRVAAAAVPDTAVGVEQDDADIGPIEGKVDGRQNGYRLAMTAEAGAS
jgi:hypothetical protein